MLFVSWRASAMKPTRIGTHLQINNKINEILLIYWHDERNLNLTLKAPRSPGINGVKSCILAISWQQNWPFRN
jgi:hypothetical protein